MSGLVLSSAPFLYISVLLFPRTLFLYLEWGGRKFLRNIGEDLPDYVASDSRKKEGRKKKRMFLLYSLGLTEG
jgi:hypothetical protein